MVLSTETPAAWMPIIADFEYKLVRGRHEKKIELEIFDR